MPITRIGRPASIQIHMILVEQIVSQQESAILVIDNCTARLHSNLVSQCGGNNSPISIVTVDCDVREDRPDETEVFRLRSG